MGFRNKIIKNYNLNNKNIKERRYKNEFTRVNRKFKSKRIIKKENNMDLLDYQEVKKHIDIMNVAYHLCLEIVEERGFEIKVMCPFCRI